MKKIKTKWDIQAHATKESIDFLLTIDRDDVIIKIHFDKKDAKKLGDFINNVLKTGQ